MTQFLTDLRGELLDGLDRHERTPRWRRPLAAPGPAARRIAVAAVAAAAAVAAMLQFADRPPDHEQEVTPQVARLEGFHASGLVAAGNSLWVAQYDISRLLRIDLQTGKVSASVDVGGSPGGVLAAAGALWVHDWERGRLLKVDPSTNRVVRTIAVATTNNDIAFAAGAVWTLDERGMLLGIDPATGTVDKRVPLAAPSDASAGMTLAAAGDTLWVAAGDGAVTEVDARRARVLGHAHGPRLPLETARRTGADASGLWISSPERREVLHIDARTRAVSRFPVPGDPGPLAVVDGQIWVGTLHDTGELTRVTILDDDGRVAGTMPTAGQRAVNIVPARGGGAWVAFGDDSTVSPAALRLPRF
jgi:outer membrane protein assembly factor BamB